MTVLELLRMIAKDVLLFGGALLVIVFFVLMIYALRTIIKANKLIDTFNTTFLLFREGMQKLLDPLLMFVNMLRMGAEKDAGGKINNEKRGPKATPAKKKTSVQKRKTTKKKVVAKTKKNVNKK